jgi:hypothetical protein
MTDAIGQSFSTGTAASTTGTQKALFGSNAPSASTHSATGCAGTGACDCKFGGPSKDVVSFSGAGKQATAAATTTQATTAADPGLNFDDLDPQIVKELGAIGLGSPKAK